MKRIEDKNKLVVEKLQLENKLKESKLQLIKSQMNPHFFFNAINNIQSFIFTKETKTASSYLSKFSKLTRKILEQSEVDKITLYEEIETLQLYLELQKMRFPELEYHIECQNLENPQQITLPTLLFQPYVENAILHGLAHSIGKKELGVTFSLAKANQL
ncbi:histidine kinase, partial [Arthrospira platensis SPKY2]